MKIFLIFHSDVVRGRKVCNTENKTMYYFVVRNADLNVLFKKKINEIKGNNSFSLVTLLVLNNTISGFSLLRRS